MNKPFHPRARRPLSALLTLPLLALCACGGSDSAVADPDAQTQDAVWNAFDWDDREWS